MRPAECSTIKCSTLFVKIKSHWPFGAAGSVTVIEKHNPLAHCLSKSSTVCPLSPPITSLLSLQILWPPHRPHSHSPTLPYPSSQRPSSLSILTSIPFHSFGITPSIKTKSDYRQIFADNTTRSLWDPTSNRRNRFYIIKITLLNSQSISPSNQIRIRSNICLEMPRKQNYVFNICSPPPSPFTQKKYNNNNMHSFIFY